MESRRRKLHIAFFLLYCLGMLWVLFHRESYETGLPYWEQVALSINLRPLHTVRLYLRLLARGRLAHLAIINLVGNLVLFIPLGYFLPGIFPWLRRLWRTVLASGLIIVTVEISQVLLLVGSCDIDDLILNLIGVSMGYPLFRLMEKYRKPGAA